MEYKYSNNTNNLIQETPEIDHFHYQEPEEDDNDDALSLCDLPLHDDDPDLTIQRYSTTTTTPDFEFSTTKILRNTDPDILFFGKSIPYGNRPQTTSTFKLHQTKPSPFHVATAIVPPPPTPTRSRAVRLPETGKLRYRSSGTKSTLNQYHVLIGLGAKFDPPKMLELREMRKRQSRRGAPSPMFSGSDGEQPGVAGGKSGAGKGHGGLARPLRFRSTLMSALTRVSFGCLRHV